MKHQYRLEGYGYRLRPIAMSDAQFVIDVRREDAERNRFIHAISPDVSEQEAWLERYFKREGDCYFVIENRITGDREGLIAFYDERNGRAEWGRWVVKKNSLAAVESVYLLYRIAFEQAELTELYCRTVADNVSVVSFHESIGEKTRARLEGAFELYGQRYDAVEQYADKEHFYARIALRLERQAQRIAERNRKRFLGEIEFHHIGVATRSIEKEYQVYTLLGYEKESDCFEDPEQGIRGLFITAKGQPRLELLENLAGSHTLDKQIEKNQKFYHAAYYVANIEAVIAYFQMNRAKIISPMKASTYFGKRICFLMLANMSLIELIEKDCDE